MSNKLVPSKQNRPFFSPPFLLLHLEKKSLKKIWPRHDWSDSCKMINSQTEIDSPPYTAKRTSRITSDFIVVVDEAGRILCERRQLWISLSRNSGIPTFSITVTLQNYFFFNEIYSLTGDILPASSRRWRVWLLCNIRAITWAPWERSLFSERFYKTR